MKLTTSHHTPQGGLRSKSIDNYRNQPGMLYREHRFLYAVFVDPLRLNREKFRIMPAALDSINLAFYAVFYLLGK